VSATLIDVWSSPEVVEILINLSETSHFRKVRILLDVPLQQCPEYLLFALSQIKVERGTLLIDELLTILMTTFLGNHPNSIPVLRKLWEMNQELMIRSICELCRHDQKIMNLSRVLDIT
jgi:CCR4-NOT transcription complex subunit 1